MKHEKSCGALTFRTENGARCVLVIRHRHGGHWAFPKGHVEPGETERETAARETLETRYSPARGVEKDVVYFVAEYDGGELRPQPDEVSEARFAPADEAMALLTFDADKRLLALAEAFLAGKEGTA